MTANNKRNKRWVLLNPGPVNVTRGVRQALLRPDICHRENEFSELLRRTRSKLLTVFGIARTHTVGFFTGSGTSAVEAMLSSYGSKNKKVLVLSNGVYGKRIKEILDAHGLPNRYLEKPVGIFPSRQEIESALQSDKKIAAIAMVHHETSSGMLNPLSQTGQIAKKFGKTFLVDAVSSLGAEEISFERDGIDFCAGSSGKCLHGYPGISFVIVARRALRELHFQKSKTLYLDLRSALTLQEKGDIPFTPAVQLFYALEQALDELKKQGLRERIRNYADKNRFIQNELGKLGIQNLIEEKFRSHVLSAFWLPEGVTYSKLHDRLKRKGFIIYAGQSKWKDRIFRVSNLGDVGVGDLQGLITEVKKIIPRRAAATTPKAIVLAAGVGKRFGKMTRRVPKCLIPLDVSGQTLLARYLESFRTLGIKNVVIVCGHLKNQIKKYCARKSDGLQIRYIENKNYRRGSILSLYCASKELNADALIMDADVFFPAEALSKLINSPLKSAFLLDPEKKSTGEEMMITALNGRLARISKKIKSGADVVGEATGILKLQKNDAVLLKKILESFVRRNRVDGEYEEAYIPLMERRPIGYESIDGHFWTEMDFEEDRQKISKHLAGSIS
jgi:2-aminoethylphosphonate-pyruvate transaminase